MLFITCYSSQHSCCRLLQQKSLNCAQAHDKPSYNTQTITSPHQPLTTQAELHRCGAAAYMSYIYGLPVNSDQRPVALGCHTIQLCQQKTSPALQRQQVGCSCTLQLLCHDALQWTQNIGPTADRTSASFQYKRTLWPQSSRYNTRGRHRPLQQDAFDKLGQANRQQAVAACKHIHTRCEGCSTPDKP